MKDEVEKLRQEIEQEINAIAAGANRADLPKSMGILIPSLDLQAAIDRILKLIQTAQVEAVRADKNGHCDNCGATIEYCNFCNDKLENY